MATDPRHLRARWMLAAAGWLLWAALMPMPIPAGSTRHLWDIYPEAWHAASRSNMYLGTVRQVIETAGLLGFLLSTGVFAISPLLLACNHSVNERIRRCRWAGLGLLAMAQLSVLLIARMLTVGGGGPSSAPAHLLVVSYLLVCIAIIPWPREGAMAGSGFEVVLPDSHRPPAQPTEEK